MNPKLTSLTVHALCLLAIAAATVAARYVPPEYATVLTGAATWLWGKYGFKPSAAVIEVLLDDLKAKGIISDPPPPPPNS